MERRELVVEAPALRVAPDKLVEPFRWGDVFEDVRPVEIEVGIGKGRFLLAAAQAHPEANYLGVEWANKYLRFAESRASKRKLTNVRFARLDVREMLPAIPDASVRAFYVFYPDPWPKKRHLKRRFFQPAHLEHVLRSLESGGTLHAATDHDEYWSVIEPLLDGLASLGRCAEFGGEAFPVPLDAPLTNFEAKYLETGRSRHRGSWYKREPTGGGGGASAVLT